MKSARYTAYGPPETIAFDDLPVPGPGPGEVLVRVRAAPVTAGDVRLRSGIVPRGMGLLLRLAIGITRPRVAPGWAYAGEIAALGPGARGFAPGDRVFGLTGFRGGAHREALVARADGRLLPLPDGLSFAEGAAFFFGGLTAAHFLIDRARLAPGDRLLIHGATGSTGSAACQIARHIGARVTATASAPNHALARGLGAETVTDYRDAPPPGPFDVILDVMGSLGWRGARPLLAPGGRLILLTATLAETLGAGLRPRRDGRRLIAGTSGETRAAMQRLVALHRAGAFRPLVGESFAFADLARAHARAGTFSKPGTPVVTMP